MSLPRNTVVIGDALEQLQKLPAESVDCVITSPPYFGLRDYGVAGQFGQEHDVDAWAEHVAAVCHELRRVLTPYGSLWLNLGDAYSRALAYGAPPKSLLLAPERVVQRLLADGWLLRNKVVWAKSNPLPSPSRDRLTTAHEFVYFLAKRPNYYFDLDAIREPLLSSRGPSSGSRTPQRALGALAGGRDGLVAMARSGRSGHPLGKNPGDVWRIGSSSFRGAHFATFPAEIVRRPLLATCPETVCTCCQQPWRRSASPVRIIDGQAQRRPIVPCSCRDQTRPGLVLDPFFGAGTVGLVAEHFGRDWLGIELNPEYAVMSDSRLAHQLRKAA